MPAKRGAQDLPSISYSQLQICPPIIPDAKGEKNGAKILVLQMTRKVYFVYAYTVIRVRRQVSLDRQKES